MMKTRIIFTLCAIILIFGCTFLSFGQGNEKTLRRFALVVGSNNGGPDRVKLRYATRDALSFVRVMKELGALADDDLIVLLDPRASEMRNGFRSLADKVARASKGMERKEAVVYYSGHSDEEGLLFGEEKIPYSEVRSVISAMDVNVRVAILDSCASGAFTRAKGVIKRPAFLIDSSSDTKGYAFLTSSAEDEVAQESDKIEGSFFTHYLVSGLRGAADSTRDGLVTLNEAYSYAFRETLQRTEKTQYGAQHPKYDIQLTGTGDLVLTDLREVTSGLVLSEELEGKFFVRDDIGNLIAEINKLAGSQVELGIEPGMYDITAEIKGKLYHSAITLADKKRVMISQDKMQRIAGETTTARGDSIGEDAETQSAEDLFDEEMNQTDSDATVPDANGFTVDVDAPDVDFEVFNFSIIPFVPLYPGPGAFNISLGLVTSDALHIKGMQMSPVGNFATYEVQGLQVTGVFNISGKDVKGAQGAGVFNMSGQNLIGVQGAGVFNFTNGDVLGAQGAGIFNYAGGIVRFAQGSGIVNIAGELLGVQGSGIGNILSSSGTGVQGSGIFNVAGAFKGVQASAIINVANDLNGLQVGLVNVANRVTGLQIGLVNVSDGFDAGFPLGLINISENGMFGFEGRYDDAGYVRGSFKSGSDVLYSIITFSYLPESNPASWSYGAGLGLDFPFGPFYANLDTTINVIEDGTGTWGKTEFSDLLPEVSLSIGFKLWRFAFFGGVSVGIEFPGMYRETNPLQEIAIPLVQGSDPLYLVPHWFTGIRF